MRKTPIIGLVEHIRKQKMKATNDRKINDSKYIIDVYVFINSKMNQRLKNDRQLWVTLASEMFFEVDFTTKSLIINLEKHIYDC